MNQSPASPNAFRVGWKLSCNPVVISFIPNIATVDAPSNGRHFIFGPVCYSVAYGTYQDKAENFKTQILLS